MMREISLSAYMNTHTENTQRSPVLRNNLLFLSGL